MTSAPARAAIAPGSRALVAILGLAREVHHAKTSREQVHEIAM